MKSEEPLALYEARRVLRETSELDAIQHSSLAEILREALAELVLLIDDTVDPLNPPWSAS